MPKALTNKKYYKQEVWVQIKYQPQIQETILKYLRNKNNYKSRDNNKIIKSKITQHSVQHWDLWLQKITVTIL